MSLTSEMNNKLEQWQENGVSAAPDVYDVRRQ
jgi:hypothetical protein